MNKTRPIHLRLIYLLLLFISTIVFSRSVTAATAVNAPGITPGSTDNFITTWQFSPEYAADANQVVIPTIPDEAYLYNVYWEISDSWGTQSGTTTGVTGDFTLSYPFSPLGQVTIRIEISGQFPRIGLERLPQLNPVNDPMLGYEALTLLSIEQWGTIAWTSMERAFYKAKQMQLNATDAPDLRNVTSLKEMFFGAEKMNAPVNHWDVSTITDMTGTFRDCLLFNQPLSNWDVSHVTDMSFMFFWGTEFNQDLSSWDVAAVTDMSHMFGLARKFNKNISGWDVGQVGNMLEMFHGAWVFNQNISSWDVSQVKDMTRMFNDAQAFNQNIANWDITQVTDMEDMLSSSGLSLANYDAILVGWAAKSGLQSGVELRATDLTFCAGAEARQKLIDEYGWTITGDIPACASMLIFVKKTDGKSLVILTASSDSMQQVKQKIQDKAGIPPAQQRLFFGGTELENGRTLADYNIQNGNTLDLIAVVNNAPIAVDDELAVTEDIPVTGNVLTNDSDPDGNALTASLVTAPVNGTVVLNADGSFTYTPGINYNGPDSLEYQVCDNGVSSLCDTAWVYYTVTAINDAPTITAPASIVVTEDVPTTLTGISFSDVDAGNGLVKAIFSVPGGTLSATSGSGTTVGGSGTGSLTLVGSIADLNAFVAAGSLRFTTALNATNNVTLTVGIDDGGNTGVDPGNSGTANSEAATTTITLTVTAINDAPVNTVPGGQEVDQNGVLTFSAANGNGIMVSDVDAGSNTVQVTLTATNGLLILSGTTGLTFITGSGTADATMTFAGTIADINAALGGLTFSPTAGYNGLASLQIVTNDLGNSGTGGAKTDIDDINITVNPINPEVVGLGSTNADGTYKVGDVITLVLAFDQPVTVDGAGGLPTLRMETGAVDREAAYMSGSGTNQLTFTYTVQAGDVSADLDYASTTALTLNGATIQSAAGLNAVLTLPAVGGPSSIAGQHAIVVDGVVPAAPTGLTVMFGNGQNVLNWAANSESDVVSYRVYGGTSASPATVLYTVTAPATTYTHAGLTNGITYYYRITAVDQAGNESAVSTEVSAVPKAPQVITFDPLSSKTYGDADFAPGATSTNNTIAITYTSSNTAVAQIVDGNIHIVGVGTTTITASQAAGTAFTAAADVTQSLTVNPKALTITANNRTKTYGETLALGTAEFMPVGLVNGDAVTSVTLASAGAVATAAVTTYDITASAALGPKLDNYTITYAKGTLTVGKKALTITANNRTKIYGETLNLGTTEFTPAGLVNGDAVTSVTLASPGAIATADAGTYDITASTALGPKLSNYDITYIKGTLTVNKAPQTITFVSPGTLSRDAGTVDLDVEASSGLPVALTIDDEMIATVNSTALTMTVRRLGTVTLTATQEGNHNYLPAAPVSVTVRIANDAGAALPIRVHRAVSPNGDGINEFLMIEGIRDYPENKVTIFDKSGKVLAEIESYDNRDRMFPNNRTVRDGTYYYYLDIKVDGEWKREKGFFVIRRQ